MMVGIVMLVVISDVVLEVQQDSTKLKAEMISTAVHAIFRFAIIA